MKPVLMIFGLISCAFAAGEECSKLEKDVEEVGEILVSLRSTDVRLTGDELRKFLKSEKLAMCYEEYAEGRWSEFAGQIERRISSVERDYKRNSRAKSTAGGMAEIVESTLIDLRKQLSALGAGDSDRKTLEARIADYEKRLAEEQKEIEKEQSENEKRIKAACEIRDKDLQAIGETVAKKVEQKVFCPMKSKLNDLRVNQNKKEGKSDAAGEVRNDNGLMDVVRNKQGLIIGLMGCVLGEKDQFDDFTFGEKVKEGQDVIGNELKTYVYELQEQIYDFTLIRLGVTAGDERLLSIQLLSPLKSGEDVNRAIEETKTKLQKKEKVIFSSIRKNDAGYIECREPQQEESNAPVVLSLAYEWNGDDYFAQGLVLGVCVNTVRSAGPEIGGLAREAHTNETEKAELANREKEQSQRERAAAELRSVDRAKNMLEKVKLIRQAMLRFAKLDDMKGVVYSLAVLLGKCEVEIPDVYEVLSAVASKSNPETAKKIKGLFEDYHEKHRENYETKKAWYQEQLRYNGLTETSFSRCVGDKKQLTYSYGVSLFRNDVMGSPMMEIWLISGHVHYPASMTPGFASKLINARIYIYNFEHHRANIEDKERERRLAVEEAEDKKRRKREISFAPKKASGKRRINSDLRRFKGPGGR